ncbi:RING-H2 finger protein atl16 [Phtheirospermum japonicum]|uniref:RING-type E3 ubiquitin transferase n=1 Tax=Phtheirospermum japonicum TaxID=374723 RepID=A0A830CNY7_9LAMI|nr:RING-H2 finger protein atl16 [Phtheirospermum japonicum]
MDLAESKALSPIKSPPTSFPIIAVAIIGILATAFLLVSYYIFVIKCCLSWRRRAEDTLVIYHSPVAAAENRGLNEAAIRSIPILKFKKNEAFDAKPCECAVCLNEFQEEEKLRVIPNCAHVFHIDCIDVWLQNSANCPLCRTSISSNRLDAQFPLNHIIFPSPSPQDPTDSFTGRDEDYVVIEIGPSRIPENSNSDELLTTINLSPRKMERIRVSRKGAKKPSHVSSMGDECIDNRQKDERFLVQPMRRSFSMDSGTDSQLYLAVQEIIQRQREVNNNHNNNDVIISPNEGCSRVNKRSFFSFGQGKGSSRSAVQPVALD